MLFRTEEPGPECDHFNEGDATCCNATSSYVVLWKPLPDEIEPQWSAVCLRHVADVDRNQVEFVRTHLPRLPLYSIRAIASSR